MPPPDAMGRLRSGTVAAAFESPRTALVAVRLLPQERDVLAKTARSRGITLSEFIRASAMQSASAPATEVEARLPLSTLRSS
jgi:uncharacterized protein (DUF1778 family)